MSTNLSEKDAKTLAEIRAAHQLMTDFVKENASGVASAICDLVPFLCSECNMSMLKSSLNVVNITFATVALNVIKSRNEIDDDTALCLPADAMEMQNALYDLSRFLKKFSSLASLIERNGEMPAFKMSISCYDQVDSV